MKLTQHTKLNNAIKLMAACSIAAMFLIGILAYDTSISGIFIFVLYAIFYVQCPGLFLMQISGIRFNHLSTRLITGFFIGWSMIVAEYFICNFVHNDLLLFALGPVLSVLFIMNLVRNRFPIDDYRFTINKLSTAFCIFVALVLLYALLNTQYIYPNPDNCDYVRMGADMSYHMGLINSLSHGYPLISLWVSDRVIKYHIFSELLYAVPVKLFGLHADFVLMSCGPYLTAYVVSGSLYCLYREFLSKKQYIGIYCLITILSNMYITKSLFSSWYFYHVLSNINNFGYGISSCMVAVVIAKYYVSKLNTDDTSIRYLSLLAVMMMLVTGIKGPVGIVLVGGMWGTFVLGLILRKVSFKSICPVLIITAAFLLVYILILGMKGQSNGEGNSFIAFATAADIAFFKGPLVAAMKSVGLPKIIRLGIVFAVFIGFLFTAFTLPFFIGYIRELILVISKRKDFNFVKITVYAACLVGLIGLFLLNYSGHSQVYFGFVTVAFAPLVSFWLFEDLYDCRKAVWKLVKIIFAICLLLTTCILFKYYCNEVENAIEHADTALTHNMYTSMSDKEYDAMEWIQENTPDDSLLATDRYYSVPLEEYDFDDRWDNRFFLYANYSNRFCYIAGSGYNLPGGDWIIRRSMILTNNRLYKAEDAERDRIAHELGIDYVVVSKRFTHVPNLEDSCYNLCYSNRDIDIYEIK